MPSANVAIVEDEFLVALQLEDIVLDNGYELSAIASDKSEAMAISVAPDVALVDLNLRDGLTGPEIARALSDRYGTRIIYVTANSGQIGLAAPTAVGVVHKPFTTKTIERAIAYALDDSLTVPRPAELHVLPEHALQRTA